MSTKLIIYILLVIVAINIFTSIYNKNWVAVAGWVVAALGWWRNL